MMTLAELHAKMPTGPVHVVALGFNGPYEVQTINVRLATCRDRMVADYLAALWNAPMGTFVGPDIVQMQKDTAEAVKGLPEYVEARLKTRRRKAGETRQVVP